MMKAKKFLTGLVAASMVLTGLPTAVFAEDSGYAETEPNAPYITAEGSVQRTTTPPAVDLEIAAAKIDGVGYETLAEAIDAAEAGDTVVLLQDMQLEETVAIAEDDDITLDLNGRDITVTKKGNRSLYAFYNEGVFTLTDSAGDGSITARGIENYGTMVMNNGTVISCDENGGYGIWNQSGGSFTMNGGAVLTTYVGGYNDNAAPTCLGNMAGATMTITGGYIESVTMRTYAVASSGTLHITPAAGREVTISGPRALAVDAGTAVINGGTFTAIDTPEGIYAPETYYALYVSNLDAVVTVNGGIFYAEEYSVMLGSAYDGETTNSNVIIRGGTFHAPLSTMKKDFNGLISGGTFSAEPAEGTVAAGCIVVNNADGTFTVRAKEDAVMDTDIYEKSFTAGAADWVEFTVTVEANDFVDTEVTGSVDFGTAAVAGLEYINSDGHWSELEDMSFGTFAMDDESFTFRVKFGSDAAGSHTFTAKLTENENSVWDTVSSFTVAEKAGSNTGGNTGSNSGSGGGGSSRPSTSTVINKNEDGSTTTTVTNTVTGTVTEKTENPDGSIVTVETKKDGTVTETTENPDGSKETVETAADGTVTTTVEQPDGVTTQTVTSSGGSVTAAVSVPAGVAQTVVTIPVAETAPGMVAVDVATGRVIKLSVPAEGGMNVALTGSANIVLVDNSRDFTDTADHWGRDAVDFVSARGIMSGMDIQTFAPDSRLNRGQMAAILHNIEANPAAATEGHSFADLPDTHWAAEPVAWAAENGYISGYSDGRFGADAGITREQLVTILYRYAGSPAVSGSLQGYADGGSVSGYAQDAMVWAMQNGIISGTDEGRLLPQGGATRAQVASILMRYMTAATKA